jgi:tape measure domain-containing protein|nr:MAG TPA: tail tape measure protein [Caudoviricetes sp.]
MTTITALNVRLGMDVSNFSEGANLAKGEVSKVATIMRQSVPPAEKYKQELDLLNRTFSEAGKQSAQYANAIDFLAKKYQQGSHAIKEVSEEEKKRQTILERGKQLTQSMQTAEEAYWQRFTQYKELRKAGAITEETYHRALEQSRKTLEAARASSDTAIAAAKKLKEEKARLAQAERDHQAVMERGRQLTQSVEKAQESHNRRVREYRELLKAGAIDQETFRRSVERSNKTLKESQTASSSAMSSIKGMAAAYLSVQTVAKSINLASQVEDATIAFEVLAGSAKDGAILFEQIRRFAAESPVTFSNAVEATKTMMSFGVATQDVQKNLRMMSDITGGNNDRFKMLSLAFSQATAAGRLMGQDLLQMVNAGFNPLQQISKTTGESMIELKKRMEDGGISIEEVRKAFADATADGGMFDGMTDRLAGTVSGKLNIALSDMEQKLADAGEAMGPLIIQLLDVFTQLKPILSAVVNLIDGMSQGLGFALAAVTDIINSVTSFSIDTTQTNKFLDMLDQRDREAAGEKLKNINAEFERRKQGVNEVAMAEHKAARDAEAERLKAIEAQKKSAEDAIKAEKKRIEDLREARKKAIEDERKEREQAAKQAEEQFQRDLDTARKSAEDYFNQQAEKNKQRRSDVSRGPGAGIEVGSAEAAKFSADMVNRQIGIAAVPEQPTPGETQIAWKAEQLYKEQQAANAKHDRQIAILDSLLRESKENGFRRIR